MKGLIPWCFTCRRVVGDESATHLDHNQGLLSPADVLTSQEAVRRDRPSGKPLCDRPVGRFGLLCELEEGHEDDCFTTEPSADEAKGIAWWNGLTVRERRERLEALGPPANVAECWAAYKAECARRGQP